MQNLALLIFNDFLLMFHDFEHVIIEIVFCGGSKLVRIESGIFRNMFKNYVLSLKLPQRLSLWKKRCMPRKLDVLNFQNVTSRLRVALHRPSIMYQCEYCPHVCPRRRQRLLEKEGNGEETRGCRCTGP